MSTYDYFHRAFRQAVGGNCAIFWQDAPQYRCTPCVTLLAFCEHLSELAIGMPVEQAMRHNPDQLLALHPDVPQYKADRATLASEAFCSAVQQITQGELI